MCLSLSFHLLHAPKSLVQDADKPSADIPELRPVLQNYLACGTKEKEAADFFALNVYEWCGVSTFDGSGYSMLQQNASDLNIPIFISETGCKIPRPRLFADQASILGKDMEDVWSGAIVYEWIEEENNYGLINYGNFSCFRSYALVDVDHRTKSGS